MRSRKNSGLSFISEKRPSEIACHINAEALDQLMRDHPHKRRRAYLEFKGANSKEILAELARAGFDMCTLKRLRSFFHTSHKGFGCLITGSSQTILKFLNCNTKVLSASIDLPEYSWLSAT